MSTKAHPDPKDASSVMEVVPHHNPQLGPVPSLTRSSVETPSSHNDVPATPLTHAINVPSSLKHRRTSKKKSSKQGPEEMMDIHTAEQYLQSLDDVEPELTAREIAEFRQELRDLRDELQLERSSTRKVFFASGLILLASSMGDTMFLRLVEDLLPDNGWARIIGQFLVTAVVWFLAIRATLDVSYISEEQRILKMRHEIRRKHRMGTIVPSQETTSSSKPPTQPSGILHQARDVAGAFKHLGQTMADTAAMERRLSQARHRQMSRRPHTSRRRSHSGRPPVSRHHKTRNSPPVSPSSEMWISGTHVQLESYPRTRPQQQAFARERTSRATGHADSTSGWTSTEFLF